MAKKFDFRLEKVLNLRTQKVTQEKLAFARVQAIRLQKEQEVEDQKEYANQISGIKGERASAAFFQAQVYHKVYVKEELNKMETELGQIKEIEDLRRVKLTDAMKDEKVLEKLKEKKKDAHMDDVKKEETNTLDEIAQQRYVKSNGNQ